MIPGGKAPRGAAYEDGLHDGTEKGDVPSETRVTKDEGGATPPGTGSADAGSRCTRAGGKGETTGVQGAAPAGRTTASLRFLDEESARKILAKLRGIDSVTVRVIGPHEFAGPEVTEFIRASGFLVSYQRIERIVPAPTRRYTLQYRGRAATITVAPDQVDI